MTDLAVEYVAVDSILPYARNARTHSAEQVDQIAASIREFGFLNPVLLDSGGTIIAGHGRVLAARRLGLDRVPTIRVEHLTDDQRRAYVLVDNQLALNAGWNPDLLRIELKALDAVKFDMPLLGFGDALAGLIAPVLPADGGEGGDDPGPQDPPKEPRSRPGDLWLLGEHRLLCGDSTNLQHVERLLGGARADLVVTDPPYNVDYGGVKQHQQRAIANDNLSREDFEDFCRAFTSVIAVVAKGCVYVFGPPGPDGRAMFGVLDEALHHSTTIVWNKDRFVLGRGKYHNKYELCWFGWVGDGKNFTDDRTLTNVWDFARPTASDLHPTMKPVELVEQAIDHASAEGHVVLDLFGGSGTTLIACARKGRRARLVELDPRYCDVIVHRWETMTGGQAVLADDDGASPAA